jgi:hypothetical protein
MNDPAAVEIILRSGRTGAILPAHYASAGRSARTAAGLGRPGRAPTSEREASALAGLYRGRDLIKPSPNIKENLTFPSVDTWAGHERLLFHGVHLEGGKVSVKGLMDEGIRAVEILVQYPELSDDGEVQYMIKNLSAGQGESQPLKPGQAYAVVLEMNAGTAGAKKGMIRVNDGSEITISAIGLVTNPAPKLSAQFKPSNNSFTAGKAYERILKISGDPGAQVGITRPNINGIVIDAPLSVKLPSSGKTEVKVAFKPSSTMPDLPSTVASFKLTSGGVNKTAALPFSVTTYWLVADDYFQKAGDARIWASWRINSSGYCIYDTRLWTESLILADGSYYGFYLNPATDNMGSKLGFWSGQILNGGLSPKFYYNIYDGVDPRLAAQFDKIDSFGIGFFVNNSAAHGAWAAKHKIQMLSLKGA